MVVDDDPDDLFIVRRLLSKAGVQNKVVAFEDPRGALDYLSREAENPNPLFVPCAVITDLNMPGVSGVELTRWIRSKPVFRDIRILMLTDSEDPADEVAAQAAGVSRILRKYPTSQGMKILLGGLPCKTA